MGGLVPIGYDVIDRRLVVNKTEVETVRESFRHYLERGSVRLLMEDLNRRGIRSKCESQGTANDRVATCSSGDLFASLRPPQFYFASGPNGRSEFANRDFRRELSTTAGKWFSLRPRICKLGRWRGLFGDPSEVSPEVGTRWRRGGDSNPRDPFESTRVPGVRVKPDSATSPR